MIAANWHGYEVKNNLFPGVPKYKKGDKFEIRHCSTVSDFDKFLGDYNNIAYLAYFGHSWSRDNWGALLIGEANALDTNLGNEMYNRNFTLIKTLKNLHNINPSAQIRLFGCRGGYINTKTSDPEYYATTCIAKELAEVLPSGVSVYGYKSTEGSVFTIYKNEGHDPSLIKSMTDKEMAERDIRMRKVKDGDPLWMVSSGTGNGWASFIGQK
jgi:hypothetical protein